jgi:hypothetical protein
MIPFLKNLKKLSPARAAAIVILGAVGLAVLLWLAGFVYKTAFQVRMGGIGIAPEKGAVSRDYDYSYGAPSVSESAPGISYGRGGAIAPTLPPMPMPPITIEPGYTPGRDAEDFEVTEYYAEIRTTRLEETCRAIESLKRERDVIFERADRGEHACSYTFKADNDSREEALAAIEALDPRELTASTESIKRALTDIEREEEILRRKLAAIEETLSGAQDAYDEITAVATRARDAETLAKIIESKLQLIERLTNERLATRSQLEQIARSHADQLDRLAFTLFRVSVTESLLVDFGEIGDSWRRAAERFAQDANDVLQGITLLLVAYALRVLAIALYLFLALIAAKYGWRFAVRFWTA